MTILIYHPLNLLHWLFNMFHVMKFVVNHKKRDAWESLHIIKMLYYDFMFATGEAHISVFSSSTDFNDHLKGDEY